MFVFKIPIFLNEDHSAYCSNWFVCLDGEDGDDDNDQDQDRQSASKKKKKKRSTGHKTTVANITTTLGSLPKIEPVDFTARVNADTGAIDNLFTNVLKPDSTGTTFAFL